MEPKSRFDREVDVPGPSTAPNRFERLNRGFVKAAHYVMERHPLGAMAKDGRILVRQGNYYGLFPSFEIGVSCIGDALFEEEPLEEVPGVCSGESDVDRFLLAGGKIAISDLGNTLYVLATRDLPNRAFEDEGTEHQVYRKGIRKARGTDLLQTVADALAAPEEVIEGSLMAVR